MKNLFCYTDVASGALGVLGCVVIYWDKEGA